MFAQAKLICSRLWRYMFCALCKKSSNVFSISRMTHDRRQCSVCVYWLFELNGTDYNDCWLKLSDWHSDCLIAAAAPELREHSSLVKVSNSKLLLNFFAFFLSVYSRWCVKLIWRWNFPSSGDCLLREISVARVTCLLALSVIFSDHTTRKLPVSLMAERDWSIWMCRHISKVP